MKATTLRDTSLQCKFKSMTLDPYFRTGLKLIDSLIAEGKNPNLLLVVDDIVQHLFTEKKVYDLANQPFSPLNLSNEIHAKTGIFSNYSLTSLVLFDSDTSSLMFKLDEMSLEKNLESMADQIINFTSEDSKLTKAYTP